MSRYSNGQHRYCVILAGGDGKRLRSLTQCVSADERPKQFCPVLGGRTPLGATRWRAARNFDPERTLFVVTRSHERYYADELADVRPRQVLIQPDILAKSPAKLAVLDTGSVGWSDLGEPERVVRLVSQLDFQCDWLETWRRSRSYAS
jgi:hypothetical protein